VFKIEQIDDLRSLSDDERSLVHDAIAGRDNLRVYRLLSEVDPRERRVVIAPTESTAEVGFAVDGFGTKSEGFQRVQRVGDRVTVVQIYVVEKLQVRKRE
jgi:hypothetical protein